MAQNTFAVPGLGVFSDNNQKTSGLPADAILTGKGSAVYSVSVTEAVTATDAPDAIKAVLAEVDESVTATEAASASVDLQTTVNEILAGTVIHRPYPFPDLYIPAVRDTVWASVNVDVDQLVVEQAYALDDPTATVDFAGVISESLTAQGFLDSGSLLVEVVSATDSPSATMDTSLEMDEAASAADAPNASVVSSQVVAEAVSAADVAGAVVDHNGQVPEVLAATDAPSALSDLDATVQEVAALSDTLTASEVDLASVAEAVSTTDVVTGGVDLSAQINEAAAPLDAPAASADLTGVVAEAVQATDVAHTSIEASVTEAASPTDVVGATVTRVFTSLGRPGSGRRGRYVHGAEAAGAEYTWTLTLRPGMARGGAETRPDVVLVAASLRVGVAHADGDLPNAIQTGRAWGGARSPAVELTANWVVVDGTAKGLHAPRHDNLWLLLAA